MTTEELLRKLKKKADEEGISEEFPPLTKEEVARCEIEMGIQLPEFVKLVYTRVANGGIGPSESLMGLIGGLGDDDDNDVMTIYRGWMDGSTEVWEDFDDEEGDVQLEWIPGVLPVCYWGCGVYTLLDCNAPGGRMVYADLTGALVNFKKEWETDSGLFQKPGVPFEEWIAPWLTEEPQSASWRSSLPITPPEPEPPREPDQLEDESHKGYKLRKAAEAGDPQAQYDYFVFIQEGSWDFDRNGGKAFNWLEKAAQQNHETACGNCSWAYRSELDGRLDWERASAYAEKTPHGLKAFYLETEHGLQTKPRPDQEYSREWWQQATAWWQKRMESDAKAAYSFAVAHDLGYAPDANRESAIAGYKRAAESGHVIAQSRLGSLTGSPELLTQAADAGDETAQYDLWRYYSENDRDWKKALKILKGLAAKTRSAKTLNKLTARAAIELAQLHLEGKQVEQDTAKAIDLLERAAKQQHSGARYLLGRLHLDDPKLRNPEKAADYFRKGSEYGDYDCFYELACCHEQGIGVAQNLPRASTLFKIAADKGHEAAAKRLEELRARMS